MPPTLSENFRHANRKPPNVSLTDPHEAWTLEPMLPDLPTITGASGWLLLAFKVLGALGFMTAANFVILYAS